MMYWERILVKSMNPKSFGFSKNIPRVIGGGQFIDKRGRLSFVNDLNLADFKRFYTIQNSNEDMIRAWQGHRKERKIFFAISGSFIIATVKIDNWEEPNQDLLCQSYVLNESKPQALLIPAGFANGIKALEKDSILIVFSEFDLNDISGDDHRWELEYFKCWKDAFNITCEDMA